MRVIEFRELFVDVTDVIFNRLLHKSFLYKRRCSRYNTFMCEHFNPSLVISEISFESLFTAHGLKKLDESFLSYLRKADELLYGQLLNYRNEGEFSPEQVSELIIAIGPLLEAYLAELFDIEEAVGQLQAATLHHDPVFAFKKYFVLREAKRAIKKLSDVDFASLNQWVTDQLKENK